MSRKERKYIKSMELTREIGHECFTAPNIDEKFVKECKNEQKTTNRYLDDVDIDEDELEAIMEALQIAEEYNLNI